MKTLYFEGAGWSDADISKATIGNCRIRTAFHLDDDKAVYLELNGTERTKRSSPELYCWQYTGFVDECHYITDDVPNNDCNKHSLMRRFLTLGRVTRTFPYTEQGVLDIVNSLGASFDAIKVLPDLGGYRVFPGKHSCDGPNGYYYGDEFHYDPEMIARREAIYSKIYETEKEELQRDWDKHRGEYGSKFAHAPGQVASPNFSLWVDEFDPGLLHLLRYFIGCNKHWTIRTDVGDTLDGWMSTAKETPLGEYGC